jgi:hypothetical protein
VGLRAGFDVREKRTISSPYPESDSGRPDRSSSLCRLSCPDSYKTINGKNRFSVHLSIILHLRKLESLQHGIGKKAN